MAITRITRLFTGVDGHSHFADIEVAMHLLERDGMRNLRTAPALVSALMFRENFVVETLELRPSRLRQFIITLSGVAEIIVHGGDSRRFGPGDTLLAEDLSGTGHRARELLGPRRSVVLPLADNFDLSAWISQDA